MRIDALLCPLTGTVKPSVAVDVSELRAWKKVSRVIIPGDGVVNVAKIQLVVTASPFEGVG